MTQFRILLHAVVLSCAVQGLPAARAAAPASPPAKVILEMNDDALKRLTPTSGQVTVARSQDPAAPGIVVTIQPGPEGYPGINLKPEGASWDLAAFGHVEARVVNTGTKPISIALRLDNAGNWQDNPWNTESVSLEPGKPGTVTTIFGYSYGKKPGYALKSAAVSNIMLFAGKSDAVQSFRIESLVAGGPAGEKPPVDPNSIRINPKDGVLLGAGVALDAATQIAAKGAQGTLAGAGDQQTLRVVFPAAKGDQSVAVKPAAGRWDLRDYLEVRVKVRNAGQTPVTPRVRLESNGGPSDTIATAAPLAPGAEAEITVPFAAAVTANLNQKGTGNRVTNDAVSGITIMAESGEGERALLVQSIKAGLPPLELPGWLGKRPPVDGEWVKTLDEEFDGPTIDDSIWNIAGPNYWDKKSHWSKDNVILGDGVVKLRYEKKRGFHNDDPKEKESDYAAGFLETYGKWVQRYGYFEARMKLPKAPGLWPALWMMPDRGVAAGEQWRRQDTGNGGMEFDIMEQLTRWGPNRYNVAMHWDGYGKDHKHHGSDKIYVQPDKDGFITAGLLWTPGLAIYYANGKEVLRWEDPRVSNVPSDLMFTLPMGGWDNSPLDDAQLPADFIIDYVRAWQRKDLASAVDGKKAPAPPVATPPAATPPAAQ